jgi:hypothetical protein
LPQRVSSRDGDAATDSKKFARPEVAPNLENLALIPCHFAEKAPRWSQTLGLIVRSPSRVSGFFRKMGKI